MCSLPQPTEVHILRVRGLNKSTTPTVKDTSCRVKYLLTRGYSRLGY